MFSFCCNFQIRPKISTVITDLFSKSTFDEHETDESCDTNEKEENHSKVSNSIPNSVSNPISNSVSNPISISSDSIWQEIHEIETTPALKMTWTKTNTQDRLMKLLKIDPRNIVSALNWILSLLQILSEHFMIIKLLLECIRSIFLNLH